MTHSFLSNLWKSPKGFYFRVILIYSIYITLLLLLMLTTWLYVYIGYGFFWGWYILSITVCIYLFKTWFIHSFFFDTLYPQHSRIVILNYAWTRFYSYSQNYVWSYIFCLFYICWIEVHMLTSKPFQCVLDEFTFAV